MKKYTYNNWLNGEVVLFYCKRYYEQSEKPIVCKWEDFETQNDVQKIKEKQEEIFEDIKKSTFIDWVDYFEKKYNSYGRYQREIFLENEINKFDPTTFGNNYLENAYSDIVILNSPNQPLYFDKYELADIKQYIFFSGNGERDYSFIHSPNSRYQNKKTKLLAQVYAQVIWDYFEWLMALRDKKGGGKSDLTKTDSPLPEVNPAIKPIFNSEYVEIIFDLLKDFFSEDHQIKLHEILRTGNDSNELLIFLGNGNRLADAFKQLIKDDIITGCEQKELEKWIYNNFSYRNNQKIKKFSIRYLNDIISTNKECKNPILNIKKGIIEKA